MSNNQQLAPITNVPPKQVGQTIQDVIDFEDVSKIVATKQTDGNYTIELIK